MGTHALTAKLLCLLMSLLSFICVDFINPMFTLLKLRFINPNYTVLMSVCVSVCLGVCVCVCVCVSVCVHDNSKSNGSIHMIFEHIVMYENSLDEFDIGHSLIKVKVTARL